MVTNVKINYGDYKDKEYYRELALMHIIETHPLLDEEFSQMSRYYHAHGNEDEFLAAKDYMIEKYNVKFIEEQPLILDSDDDWDFAIAIKVEWDGIEEEL